MKGFRAEPVAVIALINTGLALLVVFGVDVTDAQQAAIIAFVNAVCAVFLRSQVTSSSTLEAAGTSREEMKNIAANPDAQMVAVIAGRMQGGQEK